MSTNRLLLLSLLFVGVSGSSLLLANAAEDITKAFLNSLDAALHSQDENKVGQLISEGFIFVGCISTYYKKQTISTLLVAEKAGKLLMEYKSSEFTKQGGVAYTITLGGFGEPVEAKFILHKENGEYVLLRGGVPSCPKRHFVASGADVVAKTFLDAFKQDIFEGDKDKIGKRISENFQFQGCENEYNKQKLVGLLSSIPKGSKISMDFKSARFVNGDDIEYLVEAVGFSPSSIEAQFILHKENGQYVLIGGKVSTCPARRLISSLNNANLDTVARVFISKLNEAIASRSRKLVGALLADDIFVYQGCSEKLSKTQLVNLFVSDATQNQFIIFDQVYDGGHLVVKVNVRGYGSPFDAAFQLDERHGNYVALRGMTLSCHKRALTIVPDEDPIVVATEFLANLTKAITDKNVDLISEHFDDSFVFVGCTGKFTKEQIVKILIALQDQKFQFNLLNAISISDNRIEYIVQLHGNGPVLTDVYTLAYRSGRYVLTDGHVDDECKPKFVF